AWTDILHDYNVSSDTIAEMEKDVKRLDNIASRFSKIGSRPELTSADAGQMAAAVVDYMRKRVSAKVEWAFQDNSTDSIVAMSEPLLEWVLENLIKNAVDAMSGSGKLNIYVDSTPTHVTIDVADTGCGIPRNSLRRIFRPGYSTRKRGWGLGLTLAKRIVDDYHRGRIYVKESTPGIGTTFRIELPR
ncbi:MAG: ATP-binding protein, partial [Roseburia sp.]|nr:ATP-binding protein [Roseburia sp.]